MFSIIKCYIKSVNFDTFVSVVSICICVVSSLGETLSNNTTLEQLGAIVGTSIELQVKLLVSLDEQLEHNNNDTTIEEQPLDSREKIFTVQIKQG